MALSYSVIPLRCRPNLIPACARILKDEWRHCKTERLPQIVSQESTDVPCSLVLVEHHVDAPHDDTLVGHVRLIPVVGKPTAVYSESLCIDKSKRGIGLGMKFLKMTEEYIWKRGYRELYRWRNKGVVMREMEAEVPPVPTIGANLLRTYEKFVSWQGNTPSPGWEAEYEAARIATAEYVASGVDGYWYVKYLSGSGSQEKS